MSKSRIVYPGQYTEKEAGMIARLKAKHESIRNRAPLDVAAMVNGKLDQPGVSPRVNEITPEKAAHAAELYDSGNRLYTDAEYAKSLGYEITPVFPLVQEPGFMDAMPMDFGDYMVVSGHTDYIHFDKPIYPGDKLYCVVDDAGVNDITPEAGAEYRTMALWGYGRYFNQKGELVGSGANVLKESYRSLEGDMHPPRREWETPNWWSRPAHIYTDEDLENIKAMWKAETVRGAEPLYWDDVQVGDEPDPTADGPIVCDFKTDIVFSLPRSTTVVREMIEAGRESELERNPWGAWCPKGCMERKGERPDDPRPAGVMEAQTDRNGVMVNDGRTAIQNAVAVKMALRMLHNWMGDHGVLKSIWWDIMVKVAGYTDAEIPPHNWYPPQMPDIPYLDKVPGMEGKTVGAHLLENDLCIAKAHVIRKYEREGQYLVDLIWWVETIDSDIVEEGMFTVALPKR